ncbi:MAG: methyltransferase domain-containing protein [Nitrospirae bacterium]|nr:methyltransferase domain-containing protein [Nitrospirota bacterium]
MGLYQKQKKYFEKAYETGVHGWPTVGPTPFVLRALTRIKTAAASGRGRILDLGCGEGRHTLASAREGFDAVGLDYEPLAIRRARSFAKRQKISGRFRFRVGDAFRLPFPPNSFDGIIDYGCLHHVKIGDTRRYLESVIPCLKPGGYFILSCFSTRFKHHPGEKRRRHWLVHKGHYDRFFRKRDFRALFGKQFEILKAEEKADGLYVFWHLLMRKK